MVKEDCIENLDANVPDEFIEKVCAYLIEEVDWQCVSTLYSEFDIEEEYRAYCGEREMPWDYGKHFD